LAIVLITLLAAFLRLYRIEALPPGDGYDPAYYGVDALQILRGTYPIFLPTNFGREVLFSYLVAGCVLLWGPTTLAIHMASAIVGILTVPVVYFLAEEFFVEASAPVRFWGSAAASLMVALSYWHLNWSRYGVRAILVPLFAALTCYYLWRGLRRQARQDFIACGVTLGFSLYTYQAARLLPVLVVLGFGYYFIYQRTLSRRDVVNFSLVVIVSLVIFAPLGYYFLTHPGSFSERVQQALVIQPSYDASTRLKALAQQGLNVLLLFGFRGDRAPYSTIPGRPALNPFFAVLWFVGIITSLTSIVKPRSRAFFKGAFVLTWWAIMLIPASLAAKAPAAKRAIGSLPAVALLVALGGHSLVRCLQSLSVNASPYIRKGVNLFCVMLLMMGFVYSAFTTYRDYFVTWAADPDLFTHFEVGISMMGAYIRQLAPDERIYVSPDLPEHPGIRFHSNLREDVRGYNGRVCLVMPEVTPTDTTYLIAPSKDKRGLSQLQLHFPQGRIVPDPSGALHYGAPYFYAYRVPAHSAAHISPTHRLIIEWGAYIRLLGYDIDKAIYRPGDTVMVKLYDQAQQSMETNYTAFVHLYGPHNPATGNSLWAQDDSEPCRAFYPTSVWATGEIIKDTFTLVLPVEMPDGEYILKTGFYDLRTMQRLPVTEGEATDNVAVLGPIEVRMSF
jgi:hypothetical protein